MLQLVYTSVATNPFSQNELAELCAKSDANNRRVEITGILLTKKDRFLHALEGPKEAVEDTFLRIIQDPRHHDVTILSRRLTTRRDFGEWSMAHDDDPGAHGEIIDNIAKLLEHGPKSLRDKLDEFLGSRCPAATSQEASGRSGGDAGERPSH